MGCGRVGSTLARSLEDRNHTVSIIDADPDGRTLTVHVLYTSPRPPDAFIAEVQAQERRFLAALSGSGGDAGRAARPQGVAS